MSTAEQLASKLPDAVGSLDVLTCIEAARHLRALDASHQRLLEALESIRFAVDDLDEYVNRDGQLLSHIADAAIEQAKDLS